MVPPASTDDQDGARAAAERVARESFSRLVAYLTRRAGDVAAAEDALSAAFASALRVWPQTGPPRSPEAWLLTAARRELGHAERRRRVATAAEAEIQRAIAEREAAAAARPGASIPDERLGLLLLCAHPEVDPEIRTPLMLQTVLGLDAKAIGSAFLVAPATMGQRLSRAKARIRAAKIPFEPPSQAPPERMAAVLDAIYAAFGAGWRDDAFAADAGVALRDEAIWLARLAATLAPEVAEARGLLALMLFCESRRDARRAPDGGFVALDAQDPALWRGEMIDAAEAELRAATALAGIGRYQLEATIQSLHAARFRGLTAEPKAIAALYAALCAIAPSVGAAVARAAALGRAGEAAAGLAVLDALPTDKTAAYQPFWATRAHLCAADPAASAEADIAFERAIGLTEDAGVRAFLIARRAALHG